MFLKQLYIKIPKNTKIYFLKYNKFILVFKKYFTIFFFKDTEKLIYSCMKKNMLILYFKFKNFKQNFQFCRLFKNNLVKLFSNRLVHEKKSLKLVGIGYRISLLRKNCQNI